MMPPKGWKRPVSKAIDPQGDIVASPTIKVDAYLRRNPNTLIQIDCLEQSKKVGVASQVNFTALEMQESFLRGYNKGFLEGYTKAKEELL